jgi:tetratricopeptide (TPR) repeat protein
LASTEAAGPAAVPPRRRRGRRRWLWLLLAGGLLLTGGLLAREGWGYWQESAARQALAEDHFDDARHHLDLALRVRGGRPATHLLAARVDRLRGDYAAAEAHLNRATQLDGMSDPVQVGWLLLRCERGEADELAPSLLALVDRHHPDAGAILEALSRVYMHQTRYTEALRCLDRWVELDADCARALDWRGWVHNQLDHRAEAIADYERCLALQPGRSEVRFRLAEVLVESSRTDDALPLLERLRAEQPDRPGVQVDLARCRAAEGRTDEARALLGAVLEAHPDHFDALLQLGKLAHGRGEYAEAERWLRKAVARSPRDPDARYALYLALQAQPGRADDARAELARWEKDRDDRARLARLLRTELDARPRDANLVAEAGELFLGQGEDEKGLIWLKRALALDPRNAAAHKALAAYYERTGDAAKAAEHRRQIAP